jgi:hypothetical protein
LNKIKTVAVKTNYVCVYARKRVFWQIIIDNYLVGIISAVLYLILFAAAFIAAFGNPIDTAV